jgi:two-component system sensor histidine kinase YesM
MQTFGISIEPLSSIKEHFIHRKDEIGYLYKSFEKMTEDILQLIEVNYKNELLFKESQLKYLQAQINPHFLFNTLDSISWRAKLADDPVTTKIVESLSVLLRGSLSEKKQFSLEEEIELVKHYLTIQKIRYGDQLSYSIDCPEQVQSLCFPHMVLQPIIENAIKYSLEFNGEDCRIYISAASNSSILQVTIKNSGSFFEEEHMQKLENNLIETSGFGIGLLNIQQRIQLDYGKEYGIYLYNDEDRAIVEIKIPSLHKDDADAANDDC